MEETVYLNGEFMPLSAAKLPVLDRGFLFGDGVYEVVPAYGGRLFRLDAHLARLQRSLAAIRLDNPFDDAHWHRLLAEVVARNAPADQAVYLQITRGNAGRRDHAFPAPPVAPSVFIMSSALQTPSQAQREAGLRTITREDFRWLRCDIKTTSLIANCLLRQEALEAGCADVILLRNGNVTEASSANVFIVRDGRLMAPPRDQRALAGVTADLVLDLARENGIPLRVRNISLAELYAADEVWLTSSVREVIAVSAIDGMPVGDGCPGPLWRRMHALYQDCKNAAD